MWISPKPTNFVLDPHQAERIENPNNHIDSELDSTEIVKIRKKTRKFTKTEVDLELESTKP